MAIVKNYNIYIIIIILQHLNTKIKPITSFLFFYCMYIQLVFLLYKQRTKKLLKYEVYGTNLFIKTGNHTYTIRDLSTPLPLGSILLAININQKLVTIDPKLKGTILNLLSRAGNHTNTICDLSTPRPLGVILLAIDINWKLVTIDPKLKGTILNLFSRTGNHKNTVCDPLMPLPLGDLVSY